MTQYNGLNLKLLNSELNKLKTTKKANTEVILRLPPNMMMKLVCHINYF